MPALTLTVLPDAYAICQLSPRAALPDWTRTSPFLSATWTSEELSLLCREADVPGGVKALGGWHGLQVQGPLDFELTGVIAGLSTALEEHNINILTISTFSTDYLFVPGVKLEAAITTLESAGYTVMRP